MTVTLVETDIATPQKKGLMSPAEYKRSISRFTCPRIDHGATANGTADDTAAVQAAVDAALASTNNRHLHFSGTFGTVYKFDCITIDETSTDFPDWRDDFEISADPGVVLVASGNGTGHQRGTLFEFTGGNFHGLHIHHLWMTGCGHAPDFDPRTSTQLNLTTGAGIWIHDMNSAAVRLHFHDLKFEYFPYGALVICNLDGTPDTGETNDVWSSTFERMWAHDSGFSNGHCYRFATLHPGVELRQLVWFNWLDIGCAGPYTEDSRAYGICLHGNCHGVVIDRANGSARGGVYMGNIGGGCNGVTINDSHMENFDGTALYFTDGSWGRVYGGILLPGGAEFHAPGAEHRAVRVGVTANAVELYNVNYYSPTVSWLHGQPIHTSDANPPVGISVIGPDTVTTAWSEGSSSVVNLYGKFDTFTRLPGSLDVPTGDASFAGSILMTGTSKVIDLGGNNYGNYSVRLYNDGAGHIYGLGIAANEVAFQTSGQSGDIFGFYNGPTSGTRLLKISPSGGAFAGPIGVNGATPAAKPTVTGSRGSNAALADLLTKLAAIGFITDGTT